MGYELYEYEFVDNELNIWGLSVHEYEEKRKEYGLIEDGFMFERLIEYCKEEGITALCWKSDHNERDNQRDMQVGTIRNKRWFIYRNENKKEIASIKNADSFADIVVKLEQYIEKHCIDLADDEDLIEAIQSSLQEGMNWPTEFCVDIFIKAADKFILTYRKSGFYINAGVEANDAYSWIIMNIRKIKEYHYFPVDQLEPNAIIECDDSIKDIIRRDLYRMLLSIDKVTYNLGNYYEEEIHVMRSMRHLRVFYPVEEVQGLADDYVDLLMGCFVELKRKYPSIAIRGLVYYLEKHSFCTTGHYFWSESEDSGVHSTTEWQKCRQCGKIYTKDVFYNSSQWDEGEGTLGCLCSPSCMLGFSLDTEYDSGCFRVLPNKHIMKKYPGLPEEMEWDECSRDIIWNELLERFDECIDDFIRQKERLKELANMTEINRTRWEDFARIAREQRIEI